MFHSQTRKRLLLSLVPLFLFTLLVGSTLAGSKFIRADKGGVIAIEKGTKLVIPPDSLESDAWVEAEYEEEADALIFEFETSTGQTEFDPPVLLRVSKPILKKASSDVLIGENGEVISPIRGSIYVLRHFSKYYFERR